jgi:tryptophan-rich sensory protein
MKFHTLPPIIFIAMCEAVGIIGSFATASSVTTWYSMLTKPFLNPPSWVFGPVWTMLYALMGIAAYMVWKKGIERSDVRRALTVFVIQLLLNALWSPLFFGARNLTAAFVDIVLMWIAIIATIIVFKKISKPAAWLLLPYILWVSFAAYLNYALLVLN